MNNRENHRTFAAFFAGTGASFGGSYSRVSQREMGIVADGDRGPEDESLVFLNSVVTQAAVLDERGYGYDGCHTRNDATFAFGIEQPARHLYQEIRTYLSKNPGKIADVPVHCHSRGCLSGLRFAQLVSNDSEIKNRVNISLDLHDPVPGNLRAATALDVAGITTISGQLKDLSKCSAIKAVHISVQERATKLVNDNIELAFDVLIPKFPAEAKVEIDFLPGIHDIQQDFLSFDSITNEHPKYKNTYFRLPSLFDLGIYKSLQIQLERGVAINRYSTLAILKSHHQEALKDITGLPGYIKDAKSDNQRAILNKEIGMQKNFLAAIERFEQKYSGQNYPDYPADEFAKLLKETQIGIYDYLLADCKAHTDRPIQSRSLHFGGEYGMLLQPEEVESARYFNERHRNLKAELGEPMFGSVLVGFRGKRKELKTTASDDIKKFLSIELELDIDTLFQTVSLKEAQQQIDQRINSLKGTYSDTDITEIRRQLVEYQVINAYQIRQWQMKMVEEPAIEKSLMAEFPQLNVQQPDANAKKSKSIFDFLRKKPLSEAEQREINIVNRRKELQEELTEEVCKQFILSIKAMIEAVPEWRVGPGGRLGSALEGLGLLRKTKIMNGISIQERVLPEHLAIIYHHCVTAAGLMNDGGDNKWKAHFNKIAQIGREAYHHKPISFLGNKRDARAHKIYGAIDQAVTARNALKEEERSNNKKRH